MSVNDAKYGIVLYCVVLYWRPCPFSPATAFSHLSAITYTVSDLPSVPACHVRPICITFCACHNGQTNESRAISRDLLRPVTWLKNITCRQSSRNCHSRLLRALLQTTMADKIDDQHSTDAAVPVLTPVRSSDWNHVTRSCGLGSVTLLD